MVTRYFVMAKSMVMSAAYFVWSQVTLYWIHGTIATRPQANNT